MIHGTLNAYNYHGCRCEACADARWAYAHQWQATNHERCAAYSRAWRKANPDKVRESKRRRTGFLGHSVQVAENPRRGICTDCGRQRKRNEPQFHLDHLFYRLSDPLAGTVERCNSCHIKRHREKGNHNA